MLAQYDLRKTIVELTDAEPEVTVCRAGGDLFAVWAGWRGRRTIHLDVETGALTQHDGDWHLTLLNTQVTTHPADERIEEVKTIMNKVKAGIEELTIAGSTERRHNRRAYPRIYVVDVRSSAHGRLSNASQRLEQTLQVRHTRHENYHASIDVPPVIVDWAEVAEVDRT